MKSTTLGLLLTLACCSIFVSNAEELSYAEFRKTIFSLNPAKMTVQCRKVMKNCVVRMMGLLRHLDTLGRHWEDIKKIPCAKEALQEKFPDYSVECSRSNKFGKNLECFRKPETLAIMGQENSTQVHDAFECVWENSKD